MLYRYDPLVGRARYPGCRPRKPAHSILPRGRHTEPATGRGFFDRIKSIARPLIASAQLPPSVQTLAALVLGHGRSRKSTQKNTGTAQPAAAPVQDVYTAPRSAAAAVNRALTSLGSL